MIRHLYRTGLCIALLAGAVPAFAHSKLVASQPAAAATLNEAPKVIELTFNEPIRLTTLSIESPDGKSHKLEPLPTDARPKYELPAPALGAGRYELRWRGIGTDGHVVNGTVNFSIAR